MKSLQHSTYHLNGKQVLKEQFESFFNSLTGMEGWSCKIISGGGVVTYTARDPNGQEYAVMLESGKENRKSIGKKMSKA